MRDQIRRLTMIASQVTIMLSAGCDVAGPPETGDLEVTVVSGGADLDLDGYGVVLDGEQRGAVSANGVLKIQHLPRGPHTISLAGIAENCTPNAANSTDVMVRGSATTKVALNVRCVASGVFITMTTTGIDIDADGYSVSVDGRPAVAIPANGTLVVTRLTAGDHAIALSGVAPNCSSANLIPSNFTVVIGDITPITVRVACVALTGVIEIRAATSGAELDPDGYTVRLDGLASRPLASNGVARFNGVLAGAHDVNLEGVAGNCVVGGDNPRTLTVTVGGATRDTARTSFTVTCASTSGSMHVTTTTSGMELDPDGYELFIDETCYYYYCSYTSYGPIGLNGEKTVPSLPPGTKSVLLGGIARNCSVAGDNPRTVTVETALTTEVAFALTCIQTGSVDVTVTTTGSDFDPDGYVVQLHGPADTTFLVATNVTQTIAKLVPGDYTATLRGLAINCSLAGANPRTVTVPAGASTPLPFDVTCAVARQLALVSPDNSDEIYRVKENGTDLTPLTNNAVPDGDPAWSHDGLKLAFRSQPQGNSDIYTMNADGASVTRLTTDVAADLQPSWSPDGTKIAFTSVRDGHAEIYLMNADGSNQTRLTTGATGNSDPAWSPDGSQIAFTSAQLGYLEIFVMQADGANPHRLTTSINNEEPAWSPDGLKLVYRHQEDCYYGCSYSIYTINADGSGATWLTGGSDPDWSRDGKWIAFAKVSCDYYYGCYNYGIYAIHPDGGPLTPIRSGASWSPVWRP